MTRSSFFGGEERWPPSPPCDSAWPAHDIII